MYIYEHGVLVKTDTSLETAILAANATGEAIPTYADSDPVVVQHLIDVAAAQAAAAATSNNAVMQHSASINGYLEHKYIGNNQALCEQWGEVAVNTPNTTSTDVAAVFSIPFIGDPLNVQVSLVKMHSQEADELTINCKSHTPTGLIATIRRLVGSNAGNEISNVSWRALGIIDKLPQPQNND
jgi:hypothetical protein